MDNIPRPPEKPQVRRLKRNYFLPTKDRDMNFKKIAYILYIAVFIITSLVIIMNILPLEGCLVVFLTTSILIPLTSLLAHCWTELSEDTWASALKGMQDSTSEIEAYRKLYFWQKMFFSYVLASVLFLALMFNYVHDLSDKHEEHIKELKLENGGLRDDILHG